jgi:hypothetical protein
MSYSLTTIPGTPVEVVTPDTGLSDAGAALNGNFTALANVIQGIPDGLGATDPSVTTYSAAGFQVTNSVVMNIADATGGNWASNGASGDSILTYDNNNQVGYGTVWLLFSNSFSGGSGPTAGIYAIGGADFGHPEGTYTNENGFNGSVSLAWDAGTAWQLDVAFTPGSSGIPNPVSFSLTTQAGWTIDFNGNFSGNAATAGSAMILSNAYGGSGYAIKNENGVLSAFDFPSTTVVWYISGAATFSGNSDKVNSGAPASSSAPGTQWQLRADANYLYVCTATDTWKRVALSSF